MRTKGNGNDDDDLPAVVPAAPETEGDALPAGEGDAQPEPTGLAEPARGDDVESLRRERAELQEALLRRRADFENFRRRVERDRSAATAEAEAAILRQVLGTVDNLERALSAGGSDSGLRDGVALTLRELIALLESLGVTAVAPLRQRFDPALHQAILHEPVAGFEAGEVAEVFRKGYTYKDRLLRPALVKVASGGSEGTQHDRGDVQ